MIRRLYALFGSPKRLLYGALVSIVSVELLLLTFLPPVNAEKVGLLRVAAGDTNEAVIPQPRIYSNPHAPEQYAIQYPSQWGEPLVKSTSADISETVFGSVLTIRTGALLSSHSYGFLTIDEAVSILFPHISEISSVRVSGIDGKKIVYRDIAGNSSQKMTSILLKRPRSYHEYIMLTIHPIDDNETMRIVERSIDTFTLLNG